MISVNSAAVYNEYYILEKHESVGSSIGHGLHYQCSAIFPRKNQENWIWTEI